MKIRTQLYALSLLLILGYAVVSSAATPTQYIAYYRPTPYPSTITTGLHLLDGWLPSVYYGQQFQATGDRLQVGGWGDTYETYLIFDLTGLPKSVDNATLMLWAYPRGDTSTPTAFSVSAPTTSWTNTGSLTTSMTWATQPSNFNLIASYAAPASNAWQKIDITGTYRSWKTNFINNNGLTLKPATTNNVFDEFRSSRFSSYDYRPILRLTFKPPQGVTVPNFRLPLPGNLSWLITTEAGGYDCLGTYDPAHDNANYFSIDFGWATLQKKYTDPSTQNIPVLAAADGKVVYAGGSDKIANGFYAVVQHTDSHGALTLFSTRYLHLKYNPGAKPGLTVGASVSQGDIIGYMGTTGHFSNGQPSSQGVHLHFGMRYGTPLSGDTGAAASNVQYAIMDGWLLKSIQTECSVDANNKPVSYIRYYASSNKAYP